MSNIAIRVENLSKQYSITALRYRHDSLRDQIMDGLKSVFRRNGQPGSGTDTFWALKDVSFEVKRGEVLGIIGRNGAGKSTLLKILSRITGPTSGRAEIFGTVGSLLEVGTGFDRELTGRENIYLNGAVLGMRKGEIDRKFDEIVSFSEVERFIDTPVKRYSSGMYVRLAFAVAAHLEPEILIIDEVLAVGDASFQKKCLGKMDNVAKEGRTVLFVSHRMPTVQTLCTRGIYLRDGQVVEDAPVNQAVESYFNSVQQKVDGQSIADRSDRQGGDQLRTLGVEFLEGQTGARLHTLKSGQDLIIRMRFECRSQEPIENVNFSIGFFTSDGTHLFTCGSDLLGHIFRVDTGVGTCVCRIAKWPLREGRYTFNVMAHKGRVILDWVREAGYVDVEKGDYYNLGELPGGSKSGVYIDHQWEPNLAYLP